VPLRQLACFALLLLTLAACAAPGGSTPTRTIVADLPTAAATAISPPTSAPTEPAPPTAAPATVPPTDAPTAAPTAPEPTAAPTEPAATEAPTPTAPQPSTRGSEILFLRGGELHALDTASGTLRSIAPDVREFAASADGARIALVRGDGAKAELWSVRRDGSELTQLTSNDRAEATPSWAPDGAALAYGSSTSSTPYAREWQSWSAWCVNSEVRVLDLSAKAEETLAPGCDPALSPDGRRIAYAAPPSGAQEGPPLQGIQNSIRLINRQGQNGWNFATASGELGGEVATGGLLVYAPAWSPDGAQIVYQRFLGYQALVDLAISQIAPSFKGGGEPLAVGAGWLLPARFAPSGETLAIGENNYRDARGFGGYDNWSVSVIRLQGSREVAMPSGPLTAQGQQIDQLSRGQSAAWSPGGAELAVVLPPGWRPGLPDNEPIDAGEQPGEIWLWTPGQMPSRKLVDGVDFASPLAWLP
jgi:dipeptidyl aminopeptidase/acylaminoacyl peptidase